MQDLSYATDKYLAAPPYSHPPKKNCDFMKSDSISLRS